MHACDKRSGEGGGGCSGSGGGGGVALTLLVCPQHSLQLRVTRYHIVEANAHVCSRYEYSILEFIFGSSAWSDYLATSSVLCRHMKERMKAVNQQKKIEYVLTYVED